MSEAQQRKRRQLKLSRLEIVAQLYKRGYSIRKIQSEVMKRLGLEPYFDGHREQGHPNPPQRVAGKPLGEHGFGLTTRIGAYRRNVQGVVGTMGKSRKLTTPRPPANRKGSPTRDSQTGATSIRTYQTERTETEVTRLGDPSYIAEIRQQLAERRKLLGLYAPEKKDISGDMSFAAFLIESGIVDDNEQK